MARCTILRDLLASSTMAPVGRDGDLYFPGGKSSNSDWSSSFWQRVPRSYVLHPLTCPSFARDSLRCAQCIVLARSLLRRPLFHFTRILNSKISLALRCLLSFSLSLSLSHSLTLSLFLSFSRYEVCLDVVVSIVRYSFQSNAFAVLSRSVE